MAHDLIWVENRRTPKVKTKGEKYEPTEAEGKIVKRRAATAEEEKVIQRGDWVRVNEHGDKPSDSGYKRKKSKVRPGRHTNSVSTVYVENLVGINDMFDLMFALAGAEDDGYSGVTHAGLAVVAKDTGRVLLAQRAMDPTDDEDVRETWEFPGGGLDDGEEAFAGATREFEEETRLPFPMGEVVGGWRSDDGVYQGFVYSVDKEFPLANWTPTDEVQALMWLSATDDLTEINLRPEVENQTDWDMIFETVSGNTQEDDAMVASVETDYEPTYTPGDFDLNGPIPVHGVVAPEDTPSGDKRGFGAGSMTRRPLRIPFSDQHVSVGGHEGSVVVGSVDRMMRKDGLIHWEGSLMDTEDTERLIARMQHFGGSYGVSVDGDQGSIDIERTDAENMLWFDQVRAAGLTAVAIPAFHEAHVRFGHHPEMPADETLAASAYDAGDMIGARVETFDRGPGWVTNPKETKTIHDYWTKKGEPGYAKVAWGTPGDWTRAKKLIGAKIAEHSPDKVRFLNQIISQWHYDALGYWPGDLDKPGNKTTAEARAERKTKAASDGLDFEEVTRLLTEHSPEGIEPLEAMDENGDSVWEAVLTSSAGAPVVPPLSYFHRVENGDALTVEEPDANGIQRVHGYAAQWGVCHVGMNGRCVEPPRTGSDDYPDFHLGRTKTDEGYVYTGVLTYGIGHRDADTILSESPDQAYFDNVNNAWAAVRVGEDEVGIWFSGVVLPGIEADHLVKIQASGQVSGEWLHGEMRACLTVNVPGFPVQRASVQYDEEGNVMALAASAFGQVTDGPCSEPEADDPVGDLALAVMERMEAFNRFQALKRDDAARRFATIKQNWEV